ncbi:hypothetical protein [Moraxella nasicaprae]|uniref:Uncharacterized protein n=1 Tax=Moraxella nasicaprae TaxID=2904122 RepID=A0ABY6F3Z7_9GAMM|nr:hypothetical protein [Moraxella nasicaprae]UXZ04759.1 hypothetical protein LU297_09390 [Moraxella nasicaprae]
MTLSQSINSSRSLPANSPSFKFNHWRNNQSANAEFGLVIRALPFS